MSGPDPEKILHGSTEPLVLRPPVGSEVYESPGLQFRTFFLHGSEPRCRKRFLFHCLLSSLLALIAVAVLLFVLFQLGFGPLSMRYRSSSPSTCRVFFPTLNVRMTELVSANDDNSMFNVTMSEDHATDTKTVRILHLCIDRLTVMRANERCYVQPMREDWRRVCSFHMKKLQQGFGVRSAVEAIVSEELWFMQPNTIPPMIRNSHILAFCQGVPAFRLVSSPPTNGYVIDSPSNNLKEVDVLNGGSNSAEDEVFDEFSRQSTRHLHARDPFSGESNIPGLVPGRRSMDVSQMMGVRPDQIPIYTSRQESESNERPFTRNRRSLRANTQDPIHKSQAKAQPVTHCQEVSHLIEAPPILFNNENDKVTVAQDRIVHCSEQV